MAEFTRMKNPLKLAALAAKVEQLMGMAGPEWRFRHHKAEKGKRVWEIAGSYVRNCLGKWCRVAMEDVMIEDEALFTQGVVLEEASSFNEGECNKLVGEVTLPVRKNDGQLMYGLRCRRMAGAYGQPVITSPRCSISNPVQLPKPSQQDTFYQAKVRINGNRLTGVAMMRVVCDRENAFPDCVWVTGEELYELLYSNQISDSATRDLGWFALLHGQEVAKKFD